MHFRAALNKLTVNRHINIIEINVLTWMLTLLVKELLVNWSNVLLSVMHKKTKAIQRAMRAGAKGIKTQVSGRLNGAYCPCRRIL